MAIYTQFKTALAPCLLLQGILFASMYCTAFSALAGQACGGEPDLRSQNSDISTEVTFVNESRAKVTIYWLDFVGKRVFYNSLQPGEGYVQQTYLTHPWVAINAGGDCLGPYLPAQEMRIIQFD